MSRNLILKYFNNNNNWSPIVLNYQGNAVEIKKKYNVENNYIFYHFVLYYFTVYFWDWGQITDVYQKGLLKGLTCTKMAYFYHFSTDLK